MIIRGIVFFSLGISYNDLNIGSDEFNTEELNNQNKSKDGTYKYDSVKDYIDF